MATVSFTRMSDGTKADYALLEREEDRFKAGLPDRILDHMRLLEQSAGGYQISRLEHSLQTAARAEADGADSDWVATALLHDIGDMLAPMSHDSMAAAVLAPYVRAECTWVLRHHGLFQLYYYGAHVGQDPNGRDKFRDHPNYEACVTFCERWDQTSFDPAYPTPPLDHYAPLVRTIFTRKPWDPNVVREGVRVPPVALSAAE